MRRSCFFRCNPTWCRDRRLYDIASSIFAQKLSQVQGVGQVSVGGSSLPAVRVEVNPQPVSDYNVGLDQIGTFLAGANANSPKGALNNSRMTMPLLATDQLFEAKDYKDLVVVYRNNAPVRLSDLGRVVDGNEDVRNMGLARGKPAVTIQVNRQPNANIIDTVDRIEALIPQFRASLPPTVHLDVDNDRTTTIRASVIDAQRNMVISILLVIAVVFFFLRNWQGDVYPERVVPVSLIGTFGAMYLLGYNLDNLSLMALTIATGFVVDDAIVVIENITRHMELGMKPMAGRAERRERDWIHRAFDQRISGRGIYPDSSDERHCGAAVPRIRGRSLGRHFCVDGHLSDRYADDVFAAAERIAKVTDGSTGRLSNSSSG